MSDPLFYRTLKIKRGAKIDVSKRRVQVAFISEAPVVRYGTGEILDLATANFSRLNADDDAPAAPLLENHDPDKQIGCVVPGSVRIGSDKLGRCELQFSKGQRADEAFGDVQDETRTAISVGYTRDRVVAKTVIDGVECTIYSVTPHEVSLVAMPADTSVGVGRGIHSSPTDQKERAQNMPPDTTIELAEERTKNKHARAILGMQVAYKHKVSSEDAQRFINDNKTPDEFQAFILRQYGAKPVGQIDPDIGLNERELKSYSLTRALNCIANNKPLDGLELEASRAVAKNIRREPEGFFVPNDILTRGLNATTPSAGGYTIGTETLGQNMIELLRNRMIIAAMGARTLGGLVGDVAIPKHTGGATAYWLGETATVTDSQQTFGQLLLTPHRLSATTPFSKQLLVQSSIDVESFVRNDLMTSIAIEKDRAFINGSGVSGEPLGILNTTGINSVTFGAAPTWAKVVSFETEIDTDNALLGSLGYISTPATKGKWKTTQKVSGQAIFLLADGKANDYRFESSKQVPSDRVIFANFADLIIADWDGIDVVIDPYTLKKSAQVEVCINVMTDFCVRHPESVAASTDSGAQ